ncbi:MAG: helix-turn-helix transcriptional regulator [Geminicoccaceae bacterium]
MAIPSPALLHHVYLAAVMPGAWNTLLAALGAATGSAMASLFVWDRERQLQRMAPYWQIDPALAERYVRDFAAIDPMRPLIDGWPVGAPFESSVELDADLRRRSAFFQEFLVPSGGGHVLGLPVANDRKRLISVALHRAERSGPFAAEDVALLCGLGGHLNRAIGLHERLAPLHAAGHLALATLDALAMPALVVAADHRVMLANAAAEALLRVADGLRHAAGRVAADRPDDQESLTRVIAEATLARRPIGGACGIARAQVAPCLTVIATPLPLPWTEQPMALLLVDDPLQRSDPPAEALARLYRLTPTELSLTLALLAGKRLEDIAGERGVTAATLRVHLRSIFAKTDCSRQTELQRRLAVFTLLR